MFTINIAEGAIKIYNGVQPQDLADLKSAIQNISQRLDDIVVNDPAAIAALTAELKTDVDAQKAATDADTQPTQPPTP